MDAAVYARLSRKRKTADNPEGLSENVQIQTAESKAYAEDKIWPVVGTFQDDDRSASKFSRKPRPDYNRMIEAIKRNEIEVILCTEMPRLYRRIEELLEVIKLAETTRLRRIETTDGVSYDLSTPEGIHQAIGAVNNAMLESARLSKRQKRKKAAQARQGKINGGGRAYGYTKDGMSLVPEEVAILHEARDRYLAGETIKAIVRDFNARGLGPWRIENFSRMLFKKRYIGIREHNGAEYPAQWPAIFTIEEYAQMDTRRRSRAEKWPGRAQGQTRTYLLTGLVYCHCGAYMIGSRRQLPNGKYQRRYRCRAHDNYGRKVGCGRIFRSADPLEEWVKEAVFYRLDSPEVARALAPTNGEDRIDELVSGYTAAKLNLEKMVTDYATGFLDRDEFSVAKRVAEDLLQKARSDLAKYQSRRADIPIGITAIREAWDGASLEWRHSVIKLLVEKVVIMPGHPGSHEWHGHRFNPADIHIQWRI